MVVRLVRVVPEVDFRFGIRHHVDELRAARKLPSGMSRDDAVLLVSRTQLQLAFVFPEAIMGETRDGAKRTALTHIRVQLSHSAPWDPLMLANYGERAGLKIEGLKRFEDHLSKALANLRREWSEQ